MRWGVSPLFLSLSRSFSLLHIYGGLVESVTSIRAAVKKEQKVVYWKDSHCLCFYIFRVNLPQSTADAFFFWPCCMLWMIKIWNGDDGMMMMMMQKEEYLSWGSSECVGAGEKGGSVPWLQESLFPNPMLLRNPFQSGLEIKRYRVLFRNKSNTNLDKP